LFAQSASNIYIVGGLCPPVSLYDHVFHLRLSLVLQHYSSMVHLSIVISTLQGA